VSYVQASQDLGVHVPQLRDWVKKFADDPEHAFPGHGQMKPEQLEIARLKREVTKLKAERDILKNARRSFSSCGHRNGLRYVALLHHSDRGSQYTSEQFQRLMADHGVVCSMSRSGNVWDNAAMESFFSSLKTERTARKLYRTRDEAKADVFDYIERFYNPKRRHSRIGYMSPMEFERQAGLA
jgi:putative transposase